MDGHRTVIVAEVVPFDVFSVRRPCRNTHLIILNITRAFIRLKETKEMKRIIDKL